VIRKKVKFNNQFIDPSILNKPDWQLTAKEKYQKSVLEHYTNVKNQDRKRSENYRDQNIDNYGCDIIYGSDNEEKEGVSKS